VAAGFWFLSNKVVIIEALILAALGFIVAGIFHFVAIYGMTDDKETWSGQVYKTTKYARWLEQYDKEIYRTETYTVTEHYTDSKGKSQTRQVTRVREVFSHLETRTRWHEEHYDCSDSLNRTVSIDKGRHEDIVSKFGQLDSFPGNRSNWGFRERNHHMIGGDPNDYNSANKNNYVYPVTKIKSFENRVKAAPSVFSYVKVPEATKKLLFEYPENSNMFNSDRIVGGSSFNKVLWDQLNSRLGPTKKVNLIAVNFGKLSDPSLATWLESYWIGGKKNDLVICFGGIEATKPSWVNVFGWTEQELVKRNLETVILDNGIKDDTILLIEKEVVANYKIKDWRKFDYLTIPIPSSYFLICFLTELLIIGIWVPIVILNDFNKGKNNELAKQVPRILKQSRNY
jgi:hypothetical protein